MPHVRGHTVTALPPNGQAFVALLIGGNDDILRSLRSDLYEEFGIEIRNQWVTSREFCPMPPVRTDVVLVLSDFCAHQMSRDAAKLAKSNRIRHVIIGRKKSAWLNALRKCGFVHKPSWLKAQTPQGPRKELVMKSDPSKNVNGISATASNAELLQVAKEFRPLPQTPASITNAPRVVDMPRRWTDQDMQILGRMAEAWRSPGEHAWCADAERLVMDLWRETGVWRTPAVLRLRLDALRLVLRIPPGLIIGLSRASAKVRKAKVLRLRDEAQELKKPRDEWPDFISYDAALSLVGSLTRMGQVHPVLDRMLGLISYRKADVLRTLEHNEKRGLTPDMRGSGLTPLEWERRILVTLKERGPCAMSAFSLNTMDKAKHRGRAALDALVKSGAVLDGTYRATTYYRLPDHTWPPVPRKHKPRAPKPDAIVVTKVVNVGAMAIAEARNKVHPPKPTTEINQVARADVYRAMRAGEITARDAAEILRQLASGS